MLSSVYSFLKLLILHPNQIFLPSSPPSTSPALLFLSPPCTLFLFLLRKGQTSNGYLQNMAYQTKVRLSTSLYIKAGQGRWVWEVELQKSTKESEPVLFPLLGVTQEDKTMKLSHTCRVPGSVPCWSPCYWFSLCELL